MIIIYKFIIILIIDIFKKILIRNKTKNKYLNINSKQYNFTKFPN